MKLFMRFAITFCLITGILLSPLSAIENDRFLDTAPDESVEVRLAVLHPSLGSLHTLMNLREKGLLNIEKLIVVGIFHEKERVNYQKCREFIEENKIDWIRFHKISGEIIRENLYGPNALTPEFEKVFRKTDGAILFGGADIPPSIYGEKTNLLTDIRTPIRSFLESSFVFHFLGGDQNRNMIPFLDDFEEYLVFGICLGAQTINIGTGGTLVQDIWMKKYDKKSFEEVIKLGRSRWHNNPFFRLFPEKRLISYNMHPIKLKKDGKFCRTMGFQKKDTPYVLSSHHQAADKIGRNLRVIATSLDGKVVEALEHKKYPNVLGVQFHPEVSILWDPDFRFRISPDDMRERSANSILLDTPKSMAFHQKIWSWLSDNLIKNQKRRSQN